MASLKIYINNLTWWSASNVNQWCKIRSCWSNKKWAEIEIWRNPTVLFCIFIPSLTWKTVNVIKKRWKQLTCTKQDHCVNIIKSETWVLHTKYYRNIIEIFCLQMNMKANRDYIFCPFSISWSFVGELIIFHIGSANALWLCTPFALQSIFSNYWNMMFLALWEFNKGLQIHTCSYIWNVFIWQWIAETT